MNAEPLQALADALDGHIALTRQMVEIAQREQQHLIAFEPQALAGCTEEKRALMAQLEASAASVQATLEETARHEGLAAEGDGLTVRALCEHLAPARREPVETRAECLRALSSSLRELQAMTLVHAERGMRLVRSYGALLRSEDPAAATEPAGLYNASGKRRPEPVSGGTVSRNA
ncbi:MAG: flagellar export chaperone FlgN [Myxococcota bacterium]